ncbi:hypothetical protein [Haladaptatus sp. ZSTT2]|uniref:hypothetical protein n=1 Tax=Haladaptatus sp. ZSTT2 TaxID=3120515 RepID=UPI00300F03D6
MSTEEFVSRPLSEVVRSVAGAVAQGQAELDRQSLATQRDLDRAVARGDLDYPAEAAWLRFSGVDVDLQVTLSIEGEPERDSSGTIRAYRPRLVAKPLHASERSVSEYEADIASTVALQIVPVPARRD